MAIYARVSSDAQDVNNSIEAQIAECEAFARNNNMVVVEIFVEEAESGRSDNRPQFQRMVAVAVSKEKPFEIVLVWKFSRFSRDRVDNAIYKNRLKKKGVRIISIKEPTDDSPPASSWKASSKRSTPSTPRTSPRRSAAGSVMSPSVATTLATKHPTATGSRKSARMTATHSTTSSS